MPEWGALGKLLIGIGAAVMILGVLFVAAERVPGLGQWFGWFGKLPGDVSYKRDNFGLYFPLASSLVLSVVLSLLFFILGWFFRR